MTVNSQLSTGLCVQLTTLFHYLAGIFYATCAKVDDIWYPRWHIRSNEVQITGASRDSDLSVNDDEISEASTVEVVTVRYVPMTPLPRCKSDDSSERRCDVTESKDYKEIFSTSYQFRGRRMGHVMVDAATVTGDNDIWYRQKRTLTS
jgi:hypothetical protein